MKKHKIYYLLISHENRISWLKKQINANIQEINFQGTESKWPLFSNCVYSDPFPKSPLATALAFYRCKNFLSGVNGALH